MIDERLTTILLVDDEEVLRESVSDFLEDRDYRVITAENGFAALEIFKKEKPDLVLTDLRMPQMDGLELLKKIGKIAPEIPLIVVSGTGRISDTVQALQLGAWDYILKPVQDMNIIIHAVERCLERADLQLQNKRYQQDLEALVWERTGELQKANSHLAAINARLKKVLQTTKNVSVCTDVVRFGSVLLEEFAEHMAASGGSLFLCEKDGMRLIHSLETEHVPSFLPFPLKEGSILQQVMDRRKPLLNPEISLDTTIVTSGWQGYQNGSVLIFPLQADNGEVIGVLTLHNKTFPPFVEQDLEIGTILASYSCETLRAIYATENLRTSESRFRDLAEMLPEGVIETDLDFKVNYVNVKAVELFGYSEFEFLSGFNILDLIEKKQRNIARAALIQQFPGDGENAFEYQALRKSGESFPILFHCAVVKENGTPVGYRTVIVDISIIKEADRERSRLEEQYHQAQKVESIGRLAGGVAHDLNNLLTPVLGYSQLIYNETPEGNKHKDYLEQIIRASERARDLVGQLLAFSRKQTLQYQPLNINTVIERFSKLLRRTIREDIELIFDLQDDIQTVEADIGQIEQVLMNLCVNASDAMPNGGQLFFSTSMIDYHEEMSGYGLDASRKHLLLTVRDTGCGMDSELMSHIFEPFFSTKGDKGTGLGLATVYGIVSQHGGYTKVESEPGQGTTFKIFLPVVETASNEAQGVVEQLKNLNGTEDIILVEDDTAVKEMVAEFLGGLGYRIVAVENGQEALKMLEKEKFDILLTDVILPGLNGKELYLYARNLHPELKVLYMSGYANEIMGEGGVLNDDVAFIQKPFSINALAAKLRTVLDQ
ncbi:response regulator [Desulforhopalus sp. IMCC35007]|uniref:response regulator n=1 Tax=Desulforhopalus sp. IMCC35007 TaxID=2569543 RepID=UPI0010ADFDB6|nr:response regulator [Desulforhopalus sp. IMCC35007]TKB12365.1 response regulator [Desulforhopalus sp. IMCC35007]